jgi:hypothetical protein
LVGVALATKESAVGVFLPIPLMLLASRATGNAALVLWSDRAFWRSAAICAAASVFAFGLGSGLFVAPARFFAHLGYLRDLMASVAQPDVRHPLAFPYTAAGQLGYLRATAVKLVEALTGPGLLLALIGIGLAFTRRETSRLLAWLPISYLLYLFCTYRLVQIRYLMPAIILLTGFAAHAIVSLARSPRAAVRPFAVVVGSAVVVLQGFAATDYTYQMLNDSRVDAGTWLAARAKAGNQVAYFGPSQTLPPIEGHVRTVRATEGRGMYWVPRWDEAKVKEIRETWNTDRPDFIIAMPDHTSHGLPHSHSLPPRLFALLNEGRIGFRAEAEFHTAPLFPWLRLPALDYPVVNPPIRIFTPVASPAK